MTYLCDNNMRISICLIILCISCSTSAIPEVGQTSTLTPFDMDGLEPLSAGILLEQGVMSSQMRLCDEADKNLTDSIGTGNLNDAGRARAYWYIGDCWRAVNNDDLAAEAFFSFIVAGQDVLDIRDRLQYAITLGGDFVEHFRLVERMDDAKGYISAIWAKRNINFGRKIGYPIVVGNTAELVAFLEYVCNGECKIERALLHEDGIPRIPHTEQIILTRDIDNSTEQFFIIIWGS